MTLNQLMHTFPYALDEDDRVEWVEISQGQWGYFEGQRGYYEAEAYDEETWQETIKEFSEDYFFDNEVIEWRIRRNELDDDIYYSTVEILIK